ncbi:MAG: endonuclease NucS [Sulfolobales archaeon]
MKEVISSGIVEPAELVELVNKWFRRATIVMVSKCSISYSGRASSIARESTRLIILKQDGTVLVHESVGSNPLNWQPRSSIVTKKISESEVELRAIRVSPREELVIRVTGRSLVVVVELGDEGLTIYGKEEDIIEELANNPSRIISGATLIAREVSTPYGRVDIMLKDPSGKLVVVEVKRARADVEAAQQLHRYVEYYRWLGLDVYGVLVAPDISNSTLKYLGDHGLKYVKYSPKGSGAISLL